MSRIHEPQHRDYYGASGAKRYDLEAHHMAERYREARRAQNAVVGDRTGGVTCRSHVVVDLGCGTASDGLAILSANPRAKYVGVDASLHMLRQARTKLKERREFADRVVLVHRDFCHMRTGDLRESCRAAWVQHGIACVVSALVLHHYDLTVKALVYGSVYNVLAVGGCLVVTDLYTSEIGACRARAMARELEDVRTARTRLAEDGGNLNGATTLCEAHYRKENRPVTIFEDVDLLRRIGFANVDVIFRHGQLAVIVAEKKRL